MTRSQLRWSEARVGLLVALTGVLLFGAVTYVGLAGTPFARRALVHAELDDVAGVATGSRVELGGVKIGEIDSLGMPNLETGRVPITLALKHEALEKLGASSRVFLGSHALVGQRYIGVTPRKPDEPPLEDGGFIEPRATVDSQALIERAGRLMERLEGVLDDVRVVTRALAQSTEEGKGPVAALLHDEELTRALRAAFDNLRDLTDRAAHGDGLVATLVGDAALAQELRAGTKALASTARRIEQGEGVLGRLTTEGKSAKQLENMLANLETVSGRLADAKGTLGALISDPAMLVQLNALVAQLDRLVGDLRRNPRRYLKIDAF